MSEFIPSDEELEAEALAYIYGESDFSGLPIVKLGPYPSPEDHPDNDPLRPVRPLQSDEEWLAEFAELHELADRLVAVTRRDTAA